MFKLLKFDHIDGSNPLREVFYIQYEITADDGSVITKTIGRIFFMEKFKMKQSDVSEIIKNKNCKANKSGLFYFNEKSDAEQFIENVLEPCLLAHTL